MEVHACTCLVVHLGIATPVSTQDVKSFATLAMGGWLEDDANGKVWVRVPLLGASGVVAAV